MTLTIRLAGLIATAILAGGCTALVVGGAAAGGHAAGNNDRAVGTSADDGTISGQVKARLIASNYVKAGSVSVDTHEGVVTLSGSVESYQAREQAEALAKQTRGVKSVINKLEVMPVPGS